MKPFALLAGVFFGTSSSLPSPISNFIGNSSSFANMFDDLPDIEKNVGSLSPGFRPKPEQPCPLPSLYPVKSSKFYVDQMDTTNKHITVFYPDISLDNESRFPLLAYAHGYGGGGVQTVPAYWEMCTALAGYGFVVTLHHACDLGCWDSKPKGFSHYYEQQLKAIDWAVDMSRTTITQVEDAFYHLDVSLGVGVVGHSMGGQATLFSSSDVSDPSSRNISSAVYHHAWTDDFPTPQVPFLDFTSVWDDEAREATMGIPIFKSGERTGLTRGIVSTSNFGHHEADILGINPLLAQFTTAWFKWFMAAGGDDGVDWEEMIFGTGENSVCKGGMGDVERCEIVDLRS